VAEDRGAFSGFGLALGVAGVVFVFSAVRNQTVADTLRALIRGEPLAVKPTGFVAEGSPSFGAGGTVVGGSATGQAVATKAMSYAGVPYRWAQHTPSGWDCSGFVTWVLHRDFGIELPNNVHTVTGQFYVWGGARSVPRGECQAGDLVCWVSHIGIAINRDQMINAPRPGEVTQVDKIWTFPAPLIRRPLAYTASSKDKGAL
jgi:cell wall-associated NlpC family hydrolase